VTRHLLDVYPHPRRSLLVVWAKDGRRTVRTEVPYQPDFCIHSDGKPLAWAERRLAEDPRIERTWRDRARLAPGGPFEEVLRVRPWNLHDVHAVAAQLRRAVHTKGYVLFDVDHQPESRWMHARGLFPLCRLADDGSLRPHPKEDRWTYDYEVPELATMHLRAGSESPGKPSFEDPLRHVELDGVRIECAGPDDEARVLRQMHRLLRAKDPDAILTHGGDGWDVPYLLHRIRANGLEDDVWLGRAPDPVRPDQQAKSIATYGRILWRTDAHYLRGRFHVDLGKKSLADNPDRKDLHGLVYMARVSNRRLQDVNRNGPGYCLQQMQIDEAQREGAALPWKRNLSEEWKDVATLCAVDRGGQVAKPQPGLYGDVWSCDFSSYYPSIVVRHNLSSDTLNCTCCPEAQPIPDLGFHACLRRDGHQARALRPTVEHRRRIKAILKRAKEVGDVSQTEVERAEAVKAELKGLGVVCFGYFRYRNARYGCAEVHQAIQAIGRRGMDRAKGLAEDDGFEVLHMITDCLHLRRPGATRAQVLRLARRITDAVECPIDVEGRFKWLMLLDSKTRSTPGEGVGVPNRYYGAFEDGSLKVRGIELRRHGTPPFVDAVQQGMLDVLAKADGPKRFCALVPEALAVADDAARRLRARDVGLEELVIHTRTRQSVEEYTQTTASRTALLRLRDAGVEVRPGQSVGFVLTRGSGPRQGRAVPVELLGEGPFAGRTPYDVQGYLRLMARSVETLLSPRGHREGALFRRFSSAACRIRTSDLGINSPTLHQLS
jgi:DNA polymerase elongation subunit (family B)